MATDAPRTRTFRSLGEMVGEARSRRARKTKQPWFVLKMTIAIASVIIAYTCYVYIGRLCVPMIKNEQSALGRRGMGVAFLVVFVLFAFMMVWAYIKAVLTPPGHAVDYVEKVRATTPDTNAHDPQDTPARAPSKPARPRDYNEYPSGIKFDETLGVFYTPKRQGSGSGSSRTSPPTTVESGDTHQKPPTVRPPAPASEKQTRPRPTRAPSSRQTVRSARSGDAGPPPPPMGTIAGQKKRLARTPPTLPILLPEYRYCRRCSIVKPPRTHHCRSCGTCVMKYDHHCPWIGQCVGAYNQKFFLTFVVWAGMFCLWTLTTLIGLNARASSRPNFSIDPQHVVVMALSGLFSLFTVIMFLTHTSLISMNQTTVENLAARSMKQRESEMLGELHPWWNVAAKRWTQKQWDNEWGRIGFEGNVWWLGDVRKHWEQVLGPNPWTWFLPVGRAPQDGLHYERNPRFDKEGRWLPRREWPAELQ